MEDEMLLSSRPLAPRELELLKWLLDHGLPDAESFALQLGKLRAKPWCNCGCPSISLLVDDDVPLGTSSFRIISDAIGKTPDGKKIGLLLFQKDGKLSTLEVYSMDIIEGDWGFPDYKSLQTWESLGLSTMKGSEE
jgi:hypothetical protein